MAWQQFSLATCVFLALAGFSTQAEAGDPPWKQYSDPDHRFLIEYPESAATQIVSEKEPRFLSGVAFQFEQPFHTGADAGSLKFHFQISVWQNTNQLNAEAWAKENIKPGLTLETRSIQIAGRKGVRIKTTNLAWSVVKTFVADQGCIYELSYMDVAANKLLLPESTRTNWTATFDRMLGSFKILSPNAHSR